MKDSNIDKLKRIIATSSQADLLQVDLELPTDFEYGDLTTNIAMKLAKQAKSPPLELAENIVKKLNQQKFIKKNFTKVEVVTPGFINFFYNNDFLKQELKKILKNDTYGKQKVGKGKTVVVEYSSPNTNKPLHLGHLRNESLGMTLAKTFEFLGYRVIKTSVVNDRGIHIMQSLLAYLKWGEEKTPSIENKKGDHFVGNYYVRFNKEVKNNEKLKQESYDLLKKWEAGDSKTRKIWQQMNEWVYQGWQQTYSLYGSIFDKQYYESDLYDKGREIVEQGLIDEVFKKNNDGAVVVDLEKFGLGGRDTGEKILLRPDGTTVYITQDIYLAHQRFQDYKFDQLFYVVADEQNYHFKVLFKILEILGYDWSNNCHHYSYGMVDLPSGKMKSREGTVVDADELIEQLKNMARQEVANRRNDISRPETEEISEVVALAAIKYWFLKSNPKSRIKFDPNQSLDFEGNTGPYLLYTYVRLAKILTKAGKIGNKVSGEFGTDEINILRVLKDWPLVVKSFSKHHNPNIICEYLYNLASSLNNYYQVVPILKAGIKMRESRLQIVKAAHQVLKTGLDLLNIKTIERM